MNVASKLIDAIGSKELEKYSGIKVQTSKGEETAIHRKLDENVTNRSLSFEEGEKLEGKPSPSVGQAQAFKLSLISKSNARN
jgi:hypothetical protein